MNLSRRKRSDKGNSSLSGYDRKAEGTRLLI